MADKADYHHRAGSIFSTPFAVVLLGLLLWIAAGAAAVLGAVGLHQAQAQLEAVDHLTATATRYLAYAPAVMFALLGCVVLTIGAVRCAVFGRNARIVPNDLERREMLTLLRQINERLLLSDTAKRAAHRDEDVQTLRRVIEQDILSGNFDAAMSIVKELAEIYGHRQEAESYRERIASARHQDQQVRIDQAISRLDEILARHEFDRAAREASKIQRLYPDSERVQELTERVSETRRQYKQELERQFLEAAESEDVDRALDLLKELDVHLSEQDAAPLREAARRVIGKRRENLGVQFKMAVHDREWLRSLEVGEQIMREFPNSRMAEEVRGMIDTLRERAGSRPVVQFDSD